MEGPLITYHFEETPVMSSYLVAWAVGDLISESMDCKGAAKTIKVAVWGTNDRYGHGGRHLMQTRRLGPVDPVDPGPVDP
jgi:aminopeptidase N